MRLRFDTLERMRAEKSCPLPKTHNRLRQVHDLWHEAQWSYPDVDEFTTKLNACIQAARSVTFVLQKEHSHSDGFDAWYGAWRARMRADPLMKWLVDARNEIEKEGDLESHSTALVSLVVGAQEVELTRLEVDPMASPQEVASAVRVDELDESVREDAVLVVERRWTVNELPDEELLDVLGHCYGVLATVVREAHERLGYAMRTFSDETHEPSPRRIEHPRPAPPLHACHGGRQDRVLAYGLGQPHGARTNSRREHDARSSRDGTPDPGGTASSPSTVSTRRWSRRRKPRRCTASLGVSSRWTSFTDRLPG